MVPGPPPERLPLMARDQIDLTPIESRDELVALDRGGSEAA